MSLKTSELTLPSEVAVPGSVANLGGGFDTLGVAVQLYLRARIVEVRDDDGTRLVVTGSTPAVRGGNALERSFAAIARRTGLRTPTVFVEVQSDIPMAAGLGSSAAASVAGLRLFERVTAPLPERLLLAVACSVEGHADNAAPAIHGGFTSVVEHENGEPEALHWPWPPELRLVVATPSVGLATAKARSALPGVIARKDAVFNLQRVLALVHALESRQFERLRPALQDRWHQPARAALVPLLEDVLAMDDPAVFGAFLSGAGPSIALLARDDLGRIERLVMSMYERAGYPVTVRTLEVHRAGSMAQRSVGMARPNQGEDAVASLHGRPV